MIYKWSLTIYLYSLPLQVSLHFWDLIIAKGIWAIVSINVALIVLFEKELLKCESDFDVVLFS
jgi:hypothetical protein